jgi:hypothetical protein
VNGQEDQMPTKKKASKGEGRSRNSSASKRDAKAEPLEASQASTEESGRGRKSSQKSSATSASKKARGSRSQKPRARRESAAGAASGAARRGADPVSAALSEVPPTREQIAVRAYELFVQSGYQHGHSEEHWLQAERELKREYAAKKRAPRKPPSTFSSV